MCVMARLLVLLLACSCVAVVLCGEGDSQDRFVSSLIQHLNHVPERNYLYEEGILVSAQKKSENVYDVEANIKAIDPNNAQRYKLLKCHGELVESGDPGRLTVSENSSGCREEATLTTEPQQEATEAGDTQVAEAGVEATSEEAQSLEDAQPTTEVGVEPQSHAVRLDHEVLPSNQATSGEQFVAVRREHTGPCVGCSSLVSTAAAGVPELAQLAVRHIERHEPAVTHRLNRVLTVERQVQVVNGVRYILTLDVDYDACSTENSEGCLQTKTCRVSVLEKPWLKLPDGSKFRAIVSNNCTNEYLFGDDGEVLPTITESSSERDNEIDVNFNPDNHNEDARIQNNKPTPDYDAIANSGSADDILKVVNKDLQAPLTHNARELTAEEIKSLEDQIIPYADRTLALDTETVTKLGPLISYVANAEPTPFKKTIREESLALPTSSSLSTDQQRALDELIAYSNLDSQDDGRHSNPQFRIRRNVDKADELFVQRLAELLINTLNSFDSQNRILLKVLSADEETENGKVLFYIRAKVAFSSKDKSQQPTIKICNGLLDASKKDTPRLLKSFCNKIRESKMFSERKLIDFDSPELLGFIDQVITNIETKYGTKLKLLNILSADKKVVAGTVNRLSLELGFTNCVKSTSVDVSKCSLQPERGSMICKIHYFNKPWLKSNKITFKCMDAPLHSSETLQTAVVSTKDNVIDQEILKLPEEAGKTEVESLPKIKRSEPLIGGPKQQNPEIYVDLAQESLKKWEQFSNSQYRQKIIEILSVTTQVVSGTLTKINFHVANTKCLINDLTIDLNDCELSEDEEIHQCHSEIWDRPWLHDGKQINVSCNNTFPQLAKRDKRSILGGVSEIDEINSKHLKLAQESLQKLEQLEGSEYRQKVVKVTHATSQVVAGTLIKIDFDVAYTKCQINNLEGTLSECEIFEDKPIRKCRSEIWSRPWLHDGKQINVSCNNAFPQQAKIDTCGMPGGVCQVDETNSEHLKLAQESLRKLEQLEGSEYRQKVLRVTNATQQVVAGTLYKIDFDVAYTKCQVHNLTGTLSECDIFEDKPIRKCRSEIWNRPWLHDGKQINVSCNNAFHQRTKRDTCGLPGGACQVDETNSEYLKLAQESIQKLEQLEGSEYRQKVLRVTNATKQVVAGTLYKIDFDVAYTKCQVNTLTGTLSDCEIFEDKPIRKCSSEIWNRPWLKKGKEIKVSCINGSLQRTKREVFQSTSERYLTEFKMNSINDMEPKGHKFPRITSEQFGMEDVLQAQKAVKILNTRLDSGNIMKLVKIRSIKRGVNNALLTLHFDVGFTSCLVSDSIKGSDCSLLEEIPLRRCSAEIWKRRPEITDKRDINVDCEQESPSIQKVIQDINWVTVGDADQVETRKQAQLSLEKLTDTAYKMKALKVLSVSESDTEDLGKNIVFLAAFTNCSLEHPITKLSECKVKKRKMVRLCQAEIWTRGYMEPTIQCDSLRRNKRRRTVTGVEEVKTHKPTSKYYENLAKVSLLQLEWSTNAQSRQKLTKVEKIEELPGFVTRIIFDVAYTECSKFEKVEDVNACEPLMNSPHKRCTSHIWVRNWLKHGQAINVNCEANDGGELENYDIALQLAELSLKHVEKKYIHPSKQNVVRILSMDKQLISGLHYRLRFEVGFTDCLVFDYSPSCNFTKKYGSNKFCKANVWLRPWLDQPPNVKVSCKVGNDTLVPEEIYSHLQAEQLFHQFVSKYRSSYINNKDELSKRFRIFKENVGRIHEMNIREMGTAKYGVTKFADLTYEEFRKNHTGLRPDLKSTNVVPMPMAVIPNKTLPESFDWREKGAVTAVKNQGSCGSCWAFSVTGNIEGQYMIHSSKLVSLSEQELVDCDKLDQGCNGGLPDNAYRAIEQLGGLEEENVYPYDAENEKCKFDKSRVAVSITGAVNISSSEPDMAQWLAANGPISIGINANAMQFYMGGVSHPWKMLCNPGNLDHGVLIVGYGVKNYPLFHKTLPYWIVKNSWGPSWGEQGYYRVYRGDGTCGLNKMASSAVVESTA